MPTCVGCSQEIPARAAYCPRCGTPSPDAPKVAAPIDAGRASQQVEPRELKLRLQRALGRDYLVGEVLGEGGFAVVFAVQDRKLSRRDAVKVLRPELTASESAVRRFVREAEVAAGLNHPHIMPIFFVGEGEGLVYIGMPLIEGETLDACLAREGQLPEHEVVRLGAEIAEALGEAHAAGLVHRDVKPANVLLQGPKRRVLVSDFGIAKAAAARGHKLTGTGVVIGSPHYMSPEQAGGSPSVDHRSDIYALGILLWQMLAGTVPFDGPDTQTILMQHLTQPLPPLRPRRPALSPALVAVVDRCCAKQPEERFQAAAAVADALRAIVVVQPAPRPRRRRPRFAAAAAVVLAVAAIATWSLWRRSGTGEGRATSGAADTARSTEPMVAVLPFDVNVPGDTAQFARQTARSLANTIGTRYGVATVDINRLLGRWAEERRTLQAPIDSNLAFAYSLGANQLVMGSAFVAGRQARLAVDVYDSHTYARIGHGEIDGNPDSIIGLLDRLAATVAEAFCRQPAFNPNGLCFDTPARASAPLQLPFAGPLPPEPPHVYALVSREGTLMDARPGPGTSNEVAAAALAVLRGARYVPARKGGIPVAAWVDIAVTLRAPTAEPAARAPATAPAGADCRDPLVSRENPNQVCYDSRPTPRTATQVEAPAACGGAATPVTMLVQVSEAGEVVGTPAVTRPSSCQSFTALAQALAADMTFAPARRAGRPVAAWMSLLIRPGGP